MSEHDDPRRLVEGDAGFAELSAGLRSARESGPSVEQAARMRAALGLAAPAAPATARKAGADGPRAPAARSTWLKVIAGGAVVLGAALGVWRGARGPHVEPPVTTQAPPALTAEPRPSPAPVAVPAAEPIQGSAGSAAATASTRPHRGAPRAATMAVADAAADPSAELALLKRAKADARSAPAHALELVAEHERRFPHGVLVEEREVIAIEALLASGERAAAQARAARFFARFPNSAHARRVHALLEDEGASQSDTNSSAAPHPSH